MIENPPYGIDVLGILGDSVEIYPARKAQKPWCRYSLNSKNLLWKLGSRWYPHSNVHPRRTGLIRSFQRIPIEATSCLTSKQGLTGTS